MTRGPHLPDPRYHSRALVLRERGVADVRGVEGDRMSFCTAERGCRCAECAPGKQRPLRGLDGMREDFVNMCMATLTEAEIIELAARADERDVKPYTGNEDGEDPSDWASP